MTFEVADLAKQPDASYDVVSTFDVIHDMADPMAGLKSLRRVVKDDGIFVLMVVVCEEDPADNVGPMAVVKLGASIHFCMTTSLGPGRPGFGYRRFAGRQGQGIYQGSWFHLRAPIAGRTSPQRTLRNPPLTSKFSVS